MQLTSKGYINFKIGRIMTLGNILHQFIAVFFLPSSIFEVYDKLDVFHKLVVGTDLSF